MKDCRENYAKIVKYPDVFLNMIVDDLVFRNSNLLLFLAKDLHAGFIGKYEICFLVNIGSKLKMGIVILFFRNWIMYGYFQGKCMLTNVFTSGC